MRLKTMILWDVRSQMKYGIYFLYGILTVLYLGILYVMPASWWQPAAVLLILSDPGAMGLFFMGAIVLLEKSQRIPYAFAVSPVLAAEYIAAKAASLCFITLIVAFVLAAAAGMEHLGLVAAGTAFCSVMFTLLGIITAAKIHSLNQFILWTVPVEAAAFAPAVLYLFGMLPKGFQYYPVNLCLDMIAGNWPEPGGILILCLTMGVLFFLSGKSVSAMWKHAGGVSL
ncbi:ABC transporter permease [Blautia hominis]|uniref:ABC transporter permease n=1 Tax=Blautia hominis TaxID=2025493 RepID=A0ABQ0BJJ6_9FIRM